MRGASGALRRIRFGAGQTAAATLLLMGPVAFIDQPWTLPAPSLQTIAALVGLGAFSTALAYLLYFRVLARAGATNTSLVTFLIPVSAILLGVFALGEWLETHQLAGMARAARASSRERPHSHLIFCKHRWPPSPRNPELISGAAGRTKRFVGRTHTRRVKTV